MFVALINYVDFKFFVYKHIDKYIYIYIYKAITPKPVIYKAITPKPVPKYFDPLNQYGPPILY
jgi:hypothetical protein